VARGDFLEQHPEDARRFVAGWLKASISPMRTRQTAALLAKSFSGISLDDAKGCCRT